MADNYFGQYGPPLAEAPPTDNYFAKYGPPPGEGQPPPTPEGHPEGYYGGRMHLTVTKGAPDAAQAATPETPAPPHSGTATEAFGRGMASGLTGNFYDELRGLHEAGGGDPGMLDLGPIIRGAYRTITNDPEALKRYQATVEEERKSEAALTKEHPIASLAGDAGGALMLPVGAAAGAATLPLRMARGAAVGAGYGAVYGAGEGDGAADRATRAATSGVIGAAGGGAAPAVIAGAGKLAYGAGGLLGHPIEALRQARDIEGTAAGTIGKALKYDIQSGRAGMSGADVAAAHAAGQPALPIDLGGEATRGIAQDVANKSPAGRAALQGAIKPRFEDQSKRIADFLRSSVPTPANATLTQEALDVAERAANKGAYARAYKAGDRSIMSPELERLTGSPDVVDAMRDAAAKGKSRAIADGFGAFNPGVKITDDGRVIFQNKGGVPTYPNIQFWDYTHRALRDAAQAAFRAGRNDEGSYLSTLASKMRTELDAIVPEFGQARKGAAAFFGAENALEAGRKFVSMGGSLNDARAAINKMSAPQRTLFAEGFVSDLVDKVQKIPNNRSVIIDRIFNSEDGKARIALALGPQRAAEMEGFLRRENIMDLARKTVEGYSTTTRQLLMAELRKTAGHGVVGGAIGAGIEELYSGNVSVKGLLGAALLGGARIGRGAVNAQLAQRVGEMLVSNDPKVHAAIFRMAANNPQVGKMVRGAETFLEKIAGRSAGNTPPLLPSAASHADQQQQQQ